MKAMAHHVVLVWAWIVRMLMLRWAHTDPSLNPEDEPIAIDEAAIEVPAPPEPEPEPTRRAAPRPRSAEPQITWHFRTTILDRLDEYFHCLKRMRRLDSDSYDLFARVGFAIPADWYINPEHPDNRARLTKVHHLAFGGILFGTSGLAKEEFHPSFVYFQKLNRPLGVQHGTGGDIYSLTLIYDDRTRSEHFRVTQSVPLRCHVCFAPDGTLRLLRERVVVHAPITSRRSKRGRRDKFTLTTVQWRIPEWINVLGEDEKRLPILEWFALAVLTYAESTSRIIVRVARAEMTAAFGIDLSRAKYFFRDRGLELAGDGKRKRIFHAVTEHIRQVSEVRSTTVRQHYRGVRHFDWQSYRVRIVLPAHNAILRFAKATEEFEDAAHVPDGYVGMKKAGEMFNDALSR